MKASYLWRGLPGHPVHPPLTDATIGTYTFATAAAVLDAIGLAPDNGPRAWWLALVVGLIFSAPTALTGLVDWAGIARGTPLWRTATAHALTMASATVLFALAAVVGYDHYREANVTEVPLVFTLAGFVVMGVGGWLGGTVTFVHGMRVLNLVEEPAARAAAPVPHPEKEEAEGA